MREERSLNDDMHCISGNGSSVVLMRGSYVMLVVGNLGSCMMA